jgi:hypothetical protein
MALLMLIHDEDPAPVPEDPPSPAPWEPNWRLWSWVLAATVVAFAAANTAGAVSALLVLAAFGLCCRALNEAIPYGAGLSEWRQ